MYNKLAFNCFSAEKWKIDVTDVLDDVMDVFGLPKSL